MTMQIRVEHLSKTFVLHQQYGTRLPVLHDANLTVHGGECVVLHGHPAAANPPCCARCTPTTCRTAPYLDQPPGDWLDMVSADARQILAVRRHTLGWVSQFLRVIRASARWRW